MIPAFDEWDIDDVDYKTLVKMTVKFPSTVSRMAYKLMSTLGKS